MIDKGGQKVSHFLSRRDIRTDAHTQINGPYIPVSCCRPADKGHNCP